jgi:hypothetical protein
MTWPRLSLRRGIAKKLKIPAGSDPYEWSKFGSISISRGIAVDAKRLLIQLFG